MPKFVCLREISEWVREIERAIEREMRVSKMTEKISDTRETSYFIPVL